MNIYDQYDARIACIMSKIEDLRGRKKRFGQGIFEPVWEPPLTEQEMDYFWDEDTPFTANQGLLTLCHEGDGMYSVLVVNSEDADTYGTVWYYDLANDFGIVPMYDRETGKPFHFLDWLEYWVDRTMSLDQDGYFGYVETVRLPEPPDRPDIMGRKMGWIE